MMIMKTKPFHDGLRLNRWEKGNREPQAMTRGKFYMYCEKHGIIFDDVKEFQGDK